MMSDVVVIGGGPAGAAAARLLASWGYSVLLLTRAVAQAPAESIPPSTRKLFDRIGIAAAIDKAGFIRTTGNTIWWGGQERVVSFPEGEYGYQVDRAQFDGLLLALAAEAGARIESSATVLDVTPGDGDNLVRYATERGEQLARAGWVLDCSGRSGVIARHGYRRAQPGPRTLALLATWDRPEGWGLPDESHTLVESYETGWAWSVPLSATQRCIAFMVDPALTQLPGRAQLTSQYETEMKRTVRLRLLAERAVMTTPAWACDASSYDATQFGSERILLVGDAASFVDPLSSFGVKKALASAWLAAIVVNTAQTQPELRLAASKFYEARERSMFDSLQRQSAELSRSAAEGHAHAFWSERSEPDSADSGGANDGVAIDIESLRNDPDVLRAFDGLKQRDAIRLRSGPALQRQQLPVVRENRIALATHLVAPAFPFGIRYVRQVDVVTLADLASEYDQVPDLYEAYQRATAKVALPDFLGALSLLIARGLLEHA